MRTFAAGLFSRDKQQPSDALPVNEHQLLGAQSLDFLTEGKKQKYQTAERLVHFPSSKLNVDVIELTKN